MVPEWSGQRGFDVGFEWGPTGVEALASQMVVVVDVLRFTTAVDAAVGRGVLVHPHRWRNESANALAVSLGAVLADGSAGRPSLSPTSLLALAPGTSVVLPSPNGSTCAVMADEAGATVVAACLRNAAAVASWLDGATGPVSVIACGERWPDGTLRPAVEDLLGAGAVITGLSGTRSPEAQMAASAWLDARDRIAEVLAACTSGREMVARAWADDLAYASEVDVSATVPVLQDGAFVDVAS